MKSSPIYNIVNNHGRKSNSSFGSSKGYSMDVRVGTSASNSHLLANVETDFADLEDGTREFRLWVNGEIVKRGILDGKEFELAA